MLLLEAGSDGDFFTKIPIAAAVPSFGPLNWGYVTEPEENACYSDREHRCNYPRGKMLGGTSALNFMVYSRGNREDFNDWARAGNTGWSYDEVLPYFLKSERSHLNKVYVEERYHNKSGLLGTSFPRWPNAVTEAFLKGGQEAGYDVLDYNGVSQMGFSDTQTTIENGERVTTATAFIYPFLNRSNLFVFKRAFVTKILIDNGSKKAYGVEYVFMKTKHIAKATTEVILSAGAINSPQLLILSGVGPKEDLQQLNVPLIQDLPVGKILYDQTIFLYFIFLHNSTSSVSTNPLQFIDWILYRNGSFTTPSGATGIAFINTTDSKSNRPDIELLLMTASGSSSFLLQRFFKMRLDISLQYFLPYIFHPTMLIAPMLLYPKSKGFIKITTNNPYDHPLIKLNLLTHEDDMNTILRGTKYILKLAKANAFKRLNVRPSKIPLKQCDHFEIYSDEYLKCLIRYGSISIYHPMSTCKMGPSEDAEAVVGPDLKVKGVKSLRVVDAGVIPMPGAFHPNAVVIMIAERAADFIKKRMVAKNLDQL